MTQPTTIAPAEPSITTPRPGSRADRFAMPFAADVLRQYAEHHGVCIRPLAMRRTDVNTGLTQVIDIPCGARLASKCKPCAERNRRLRIQQLREGWHLEEEPAVAIEKPSSDVMALVSTRSHLEFDRAALMVQPMAPEARASELDAVDAAIRDVEAELATQRVRGHLPTDRDNKKAPVKRSTRRRSDATDLPRLPVHGRTVGRTYAGKDGRVYRPSTLLTLTLDSHGLVHQVRRRDGQLAACECGALHGWRDPVLGTPIDPSTYDYRSAALDAIHFARVLDRFWQNLRRAVGWNVQYAGAVELQRRLAPHAHFAVRGTMPRKLITQVAQATYHHVWWPPFDRAAYTVDKPPIWDTEQSAYVDPKARAPLTAWETAILATTDDDAQPAYVARLGRTDARGITQGTKDAERSIRYVTKYLTKDLAEQAKPASPQQQAHFDRLHAELAVLPCSPTCANWLLYGVQPDKAKAGLVPGRCTGKVHQRSTLGFTGRRVLISRQWSGKTLTDHRADNRAWIDTVLSGALAENENQNGHEDEGKASRGQRDNAEEPQRYLFELARRDDPDVPPIGVRLLRAVAERKRWRDEIDRLTKDKNQAVSANKISTGEE